MSLVSKGRADRRAVDRVAVDVPADNIGSVDLWRLGLVLAVQDNMPDEL